MPITDRAFIKELLAAGYSIERTKKGHYNVIDKNGIVIANFAVGHGRNKGQVLDVYLSKVRKAIRVTKESEDERKTILEEGR